MQKVSFDKGASGFVLLLPARRKKKTIEYTGVSLQDVCSGTLAGLTLDRLKDFPQPPVSVFSDS